MIDVTAIVKDVPDLDVRGPSARAARLEGSMILRIASEVAQQEARGHKVGNFTIGDFASKLYPIPVALRDGIKAQLDAGQTNYPPAIGLPELREAIAGFYTRKFGVRYTEACVQVGAGARPPLFAAYSCLLDPGDVVVYPVPSWNVGYYVYLNEAVGRPIVTRPEDGFMPTVDALLPHLSEARLVMLNSPLNPTGTTLTAPLLTAICQAIVEENARRSRDGARPVFLVYDQVYWQLTFGDVVHVDPVSLVPEIAPYAVYIDAISKCWAATGLRVGWAVCPPWLRNRMGPLIGHLGGWAARAEQKATAVLLADETQLGSYKSEFSGRIQGSLDRLYAGLQSMASDGLPVRAIVPQGALYLSVRMDVIGRRVGDRTLKTDDDLRRWLLEEAQVAQVPFTAFGYPEGTGWFRMSVGAVSEADVDTALTRLRALLMAV